MPSLIDPSIPLQQVNGFQQGMQNMQSLANLRNTQTAGQILQQDATQGAQQQAEWQGLRDAMADSTSEIHNADGTVDPQKLAAYANKNMPLTGSAHVDAITGSLDKINTYKTNLANMGEQDMGRVNNLFNSWQRPDGSLAVTPQQMGQQIDAITPSLTGAGVNYLSHAKDMLASAAMNGNSSVLAQTVAQLGRTTTGATQQAADRRAAVGSLNTGPAVVPVSMSGDYGAAPGSQMGAGVQMALSPGERQSVGQDAFGNPSVINKDAQGNIVSGPGVQSPFGPKPLAPGDVQAIPLLTQQRAQANAAAQQAPTQRYNNSQIMQLAGEANIGPGSKNWSNIAGMANTALNAVGIKTDGFTPYQLLGHYVALQAQNNAQTMGVHTDAGQALASTAAGTPDNMNQKALIEATKTNDALSRGVQDYNTGMEAAVKANGGDVRAVRDFQNQWSQNFDPTLYKMRNAIDAGNKQEAQQIWSGLTPNQQQQLKAKQQNLLNLVNNGHL